MQVTNTRHAIEEPGSKTVIAILRRSVASIKEWRFSENGNPEFLVEDLYGHWWHLPCEQAIDRYGDIYLCVVTAHKVGRRHPRTGYPYNLHFGSRGSRLSELTDILNRNAPGYHGDTWVERIRDYFRRGARKTTVFSPNAVVTNTNKVWVRQGEWKKTGREEGRTYTPIMEIEVKDGDVCKTGNKAWVQTNETHVAIKLECPANARGKSYWALRRED